MFNLRNFNSINRNFLKPFLFCFSAFSIFFCSANISQAATFTVTRNDDRNTTCVSGVDCTLREAVKAFNASSTSDVINFAPGLTMITLASGDTGDIKINKTFGSLLINGPGANILTIDGGTGANRIFEINSTTVTIYGVKMQGGGGFISPDSNGYGGAIYSIGGSLTLNAVVVENNGGSNVIGGGVDFFAGKNLIVNSTISNNQSKFGAIYLTNSGGTLAIVNSTISGNTAAGYLGVACAAICNEGTITIRNSTITNNTAITEDNGGISNFGTLNIGNTIIAGNTAVIFPEIRNTGTVTSSGNNLIGDSPGDSTNTLNPITYQASDILDTPPMLGTLQNNGGATPTHALLTGSPAIDKGRNALLINPFTNSPIVTDQRGLMRVVDGNGDATQTADIGAFEAQNAPTAASVTVGGRVRTAKGQGIRNVLISLTGANGETRTVISSAFGYYHFTDVPAGETYIITARAKRYQFGEPTQVRSISEDTDDINFAAIINE